MEAPTRVAWFGTIVGVVIDDVEASLRANEEALGDIELEAAAEISVE